MSSRFFARRALPILCLVYFLIPFGIRGARFSVQRMKNDVKDWLPSSFKETREVEWFAEHFLGGRFVMVSWPGCSQDDPRYHLFLKKLGAEMGDPPGAAEALQAQEMARQDPTFQPTEDQIRNYENLRARQLGDRLGLFTDGEYHENWAGAGEKWLRGQGDVWYYLLPDGRLFKWRTSNTAIGAAWRTFKQQTGQLTLEGEWVATLGQGGPARNRYFANPRLVTARLCSDVLSGPLLVERLAAPDGPIWPRGSRLSDDQKRMLAQAQVRERLTGLLFGPAAPADFGWTVDSLEKFFQQREWIQPPADWRTRTANFIDQLVRSRHQGQFESLLGAPEHVRERHWRDLFAALDTPVPARQTSMLVTLSPVGRQDMSRLVGRDVLGKPRGRLLTLAEECGVDPSDVGGSLHLGGPPVDNVAIDEEGAVTLLRLVGFSVLLGVGLSYLSFRSVRITLMVFTVGGVSAIASLAIVYWSGASVDAVLMSMPSLVYVLGLSGAVHIVNYYRDAAEEHGPEGAAERALSHGWGPCTLAALTTALGLASLYASNIMPIRKFGLYSAIGVLATLVLLFTYLPSALQVWPPGYRRRESAAPRVSTLTRWISGFWDRLGLFVTRRYAVVAAVCLIGLVAAGMGLFKIRTSVQLLKLFDPNAKIIRDYAWLENNLGNLVPMELVIRVPQSHRRSVDAESDQRDNIEAALQYNLLERVELTHRVQTVLEQEFGPRGRRFLGRGMSAATYAPEPPPPAAAAAGLTNSLSIERSATNARLEKLWLPEMMGGDFLQIDTSPQHRGSELWRVSLRVAALSDIDYGQFVHELKRAVEPVLAAYQSRDEILRAVDQQRRASGRKGGFRKANILLLGAAPPTPYQDRGEDPTGRSSEQRPPAPDEPVDQTRIFAETLQDLLIKAGCDGAYQPRWIDPEQTRLSDLFPNQEALAAALSTQPDCVVLVRNHADYDLAFLQQHASAWVDARSHESHFGEPPSWVQRLTGEQPSMDQPASKTAAENGAAIHCVYTGVIPVVYKAQRTLLFSLMDSIGWAFGLIAIVMMVLLRRGDRSWKHAVNPVGGLLSMIPNVFPVVLIFGLMGHLGVLVDIGSMMTASVAMGVAVDDTIHFLTWFRKGVRQGMSRRDAIMLAYSRCAMAMTQTTLIGGVGLSVFAASTFTPTQRFGVLMLALLAAALIGDLILLPALLASPIGRFFAPAVAEPERLTIDDIQPSLEDAETPALLTVVRPEDDELRSAS